ncbi:hypothetical protein D3854_02050 [Streptococcus mutans]|nr:hypothetical protein [Streptococcus mutans]NLQ43823.1 hypothetical protein [Streptococcus mutans]NLQ46836.1 hypothetical protein [Streptococcus mutans]NLQ48963.1 hypothetical protein [Streptococcus mutans]NLQ51032.1 hypothetical protein [Streptococcus mutans]
MSVGMGVIERGSFDFPASAILQKRETKCLKNKPFT